MRALLWLLLIVAFALGTSGVLTIAPRVSPEVAQQQRTTAPWMSGERR